MRPAASAGPLPFALLGRPVDHSLSPRIHRRAFRALGRDACYVALDTRPRELEGAMRSLARSGGGGNVTLPHKGRAARTVEVPTGAVRATGACNCFWRNADGLLAGDNTDVAGFREAVSALLGDSEPLADRSVLLLGAGGGARAAAYACLRGGAVSLDVLNRTVARAVELAEHFGDGRVRVLEGPDGAADGYDLVVNATSLGLEPSDPLPMELDDVSAAAALDLVYGRDGTAWTAHARGLGIPAADGGEMLIRQAAASLRRWFGEAPELEVLRTALAEGR